MRNLFIPVGRPLWIAAALAVGVLGLASVSCQEAEKQEEVPVADLGNYIGQTVTVKGCIGPFSKKEETATTRVFTLRDAYGDMVKVRTEDAYPIFGVTYFITGRPERAAAGDQVYLHEQSRERAYDVWKKIKRLLVAVAVVLVFLTALIIKYVRNKVAEAKKVAAEAEKAAAEAKETALSEAWGYAEVVSGPDQKKMFALRGDQIVVGRGQDPIMDIGLSDPRVSGEHGLITRDRERRTVYYEDTHSTNGSWLGTQPLEKGKRVEINPGDALGLGPDTCVRIAGIGEGPGGTIPVGAGTTESWVWAQTEREPEAQSGDDATR